MFDSLNHAKKYCRLKNPRPPRVLVTTQRSAYVSTIISLSGLRKQGILKCL